MRQIPILIFLIYMLPAGLAQNLPDPSDPAARPYDLSSDPVLYTVGYSHLDTEWRWDYETTVNQFLKNTLDENFRMFEKYKGYRFTFSGARRYRMMKEYYPERYEQLKKHIASGRWNVGGSSVDECDVNVPSPESVIRQVLYGNRYFKSEFGKESVDFMLPDCFGFQAHLPSALAHAGLKGFSTQKLSWGSANGIPFNIGMWKGPDGRGIVSALNATDYNGRVLPRFDTSAYWINRVMDNGKKYGVFADYRYYGVGDTGGSPREDDIRNAVESAGRQNGAIRVLLTSSDQFFRDLTAEQAAKLPVYSGDLLLTEHSAGSLTSQAYMKRWNRMNERLARATEPLAAMADWLGGISYPQAKLSEAWWLVLGSQMHDILPGTSIPKAYTYAWNDEILAMNQFASVMQSSAAAVARAMDTRGRGKALLVYNPLAIGRRDIVEAEIPYPEGSPPAIMVVDPLGDTIPVQITNYSKNSVRILFSAEAGPVGMACYDVIPISLQQSYRTDLSASVSVLDNAQLRVTISKAGDISSIVDKKLGKELLSSPIRLSFHKEHPAYWPAWNMDWKDRQLPPAGFVDGPASIALVEKGPLRSVVQVNRKAGNSEFRQEIILESGQPVVKIKNTIAWQSKGVSLKATLPLKASNTFATYNLGLGVAERETNNEKKYEVPSREWFDLTDQSGSFGISVLEESKFGSDKPDNKTLRLTLLHTPATNTFHDQATQDWGIHECTFGIYPHKGDWRAGMTNWKAAALNQPLIAFVTGQHAGHLGKSFTFVESSSPAIDIRAIKKAENGKDIIIRLQELTGTDQAEAEITFAVKVLKAREVDGQEKFLGDAVLRNGKLVVTMGGFALRTFAIQIAPPEATVEQPAVFEMPLVFDKDVVSTDDNRSNGRMDERGISYPAEQFPSALTMNGIQFNLGQTFTGKNNAMVCRGQKIDVPKTGNYDYVYLLAAAVTDTSGIFRTGSMKHNLAFRSFTGMIGQFDNRTWDEYGRISGLEKGFIHRDEVAWFATHMHCDTSNLPYRYGYIYLYKLPLPAGTTTIQVPENEAMVLFAMTFARSSFENAVPAMPLYDDFTGREALQLNLHTSYVKPGMKGSGEMKISRKRDLAGLPARLTMKDYADLHQPNGVTVDYTFSGADSAVKVPGIQSGMAVGALNDGMFELLPGDSVLDRWSASGEGRIRMDLQRETEIDSIHMFAVQRLNRGGQSFSLWGATGDSSPSVTGDPVASGWTLISFVRPADIWGNDIALYTLTPGKGTALRYRYLMWVSEDSPHGPFYFREIDLFQKQY